MLGKNRQTVTKMMTFYRVKRNKCGQIPIEEIDRLLASDR
ncbi:hypothetical protein X949_4044 [Burkholderia pseudomallei MSHR5609]|nr:hypothetical protein X949_4044 [Burkholderia pseudomallei MSHR5609]KGX76420.1 hypothetical protein Y033_2047 [Burkholderia pseudomallei MSHR435]